MFQVGLGSASKKRRNNSTNHSTAVPSSTQQHEKDTFHGRTWHTSSGGSALPTCSQRLLKLGDAESATGSPASSLTARRSRRRKHLICRLFSTFLGLLLCYVIHHQASRKLLLNHHGYEVDELLSYLDIGKTKRRTRVHVCRTKRTIHGQRLLLTKFGYEVVDATKGEEWDMVYGGYMYCNKQIEYQIIQNNDTNTNATTPMEMARNVRTGEMMEMEAVSVPGVNHLLSQQGWQNLKPHQVYHNCPGCRQSYCDKVQLCNILRKVDPTQCYILPQDLKRVQRDFERQNHGVPIDQRTPWVLKGNRHGGRGVQFINSMEDLPTQGHDNASDWYIVQPYQAPYLPHSDTEGYRSIFHRKTELRIHVAVTNVYPLRAYAHSAQVITFAPVRYENASAAIANKCMSDTSSGTKYCNKFVDKEFDAWLKRVNAHHYQVTIDDYIKAGGMRREELQLLLNRSYELIAQTLLAGHDALEQHVVNQGIRDSRSTCFSHHRFDLGIGVGLKPFLFEVTEVPSSGGQVVPIVTDHLFTMLGLNAEPRPPEERAQYELEHRMEWQLLPNMPQLGSYNKSENSGANNLHTKDQ